MQSTLKRLAAVAALGTMGILAPAAGASAAVTPAAPARFALPAAGFPATGLGLGFPATGFVPGAGLGGDVAFGLGVATGGALPLAFAGPGVGQVATVVGPTIITTAPSLFINTNNQVTAGAAVSGGQVGP